MCGFAHHTRSGRWSTGRGQELAETQERLRGKLPGWGGANRKEDFNRELRRKAVCHSGVEPRLLRALGVVKGRRGRGRRRVKSSAQWGANRKEMYNAKVVVGALHWVGVDHRPRSGREQWVLNFLMRMPRSCGGGRSDHRALYKSDKKRPTTTFDTKWGGSQKKHKQKGEGIDKCV